jgi:hypothetical protein
MLTDEQIKELCCEWVYVAPGREFQEYVPFGRAIEAAATAPLLERINYLLSDRNLEKKMRKDADERIAELERQLEQARWDAEWRPIETAPKDRAILIWIEGPVGWAPGPWRGAWSWVESQWSVHLPFTIDGKVVIATKLPQPTHWKPLPAPPIAAIQAEVKP